MHSGKLIAEDVEGNLTKEKAIFKGKTISGFYDRIFMLHIV